MFKRKINKISLINNVIIFKQQKNNTKFKINKVATSFRK